MEFKTPDTDVEGLIGRLRAELQRHGTTGPSTPPSPAGSTSVPEQVPSSQIPTTTADVWHTLAEAFRIHKLDPRIPGFLHPFVRNQAEVNRKLFKLVALQQKQIEALLDRIQVVQEVNFASLKAELIVQKQAMTRLLDALESTQPTPSTPALASTASWAQQHEMDAFYLAFHNRHRGSRDEIKKRMRTYLPRVSEAMAGTPERPVLDLGCGRGEWLELLQEYGYAARGVEQNAPLLAACREKGLDVVEANALVYLKSLPDRSAGMITGFHLIEHVPFPAVVELIAQTHRVLQDGGLAVMETPNPSNVLVGASTFYTDPTHQRPVPSALAQFLFEYVGFPKVELLFLQPCDGSNQTPVADSPVAQRFHEFFYGPRDYAVIGTKASTAQSKEAVTSNSRA